MNQNEQTENLVEKTVLGVTQAWEYEELAPYEFAEEFSKDVYAALKRRHLTIDIVLEMLEIMEKSKIFDNATTQYLRDMINMLLKESEENGKT